MDETLMFARLTDNQECMESCLCNFAVGLEQLLRDECVIRLTAISGTAIM